MLSQGSYKTSASRHPTSKTELSQLIPGYRLYARTEGKSKATADIVVNSVTYFHNYKGVRCSPHTLRHTAALMWIRNGGDPFILQLILGHSTLDIVRIYVNLGQSDVEAAHSKFSPANNLDLKEPRAKNPK